jgi:hypothetical protein
MQHIIITIESRLLGYYATFFGRQVLKFQRNLLPRSSGFLQR